ncbi:MAG TPA: class I SAM-dependent methyltransferase [Candidatus Acidoferrales bacterium]|nr:class I SAM-dependent methyltransferase [Candidatus Acidoferrales bacterium]
MKQPTQSELENTWGNREYIESWSARMDWQRPVREMQMTAVGLMISHPLEAPIRILDLACGFGALAAFLLAERPSASAVCVDASEEMLRMARERMARFGDRVDYARASLQTPAWLKSVSGRFDAVVSSRALHHFSGGFRRRAIYAEAFGLLRPGGCFINADNVRPLTESLRRRYRRASDELFAKYVREKTGGKMTLAEVKKATEVPSHGPHDNGLLDQELAWLREAGFEDVDCFWKFGNFVTYGGFRPAK